MSNEDLAKLLGTNVRTFERYRVRGLTPPADGESPAAWLERATKWRAEHRRKPGPKGAATDTQKHADLRFRLAKAEIAELDLAERRGDLHSKRECEALAVKRLSDLRAAFAMLPDRFARRAFQAPSPEAIKVIAEAEVRRCLELLVHGEGGEEIEEGVDARDAGRAPVAGAGHSERVGRSKHPPARPRVS